jgi:hypothetical protein
MPDEAPSFERDVKPLFRESDRAAMSKAFDLWSAADVAAHGGAIVAHLRDGSMPCDGPWPAERVDIVSRWLDAGAQP